MIVYFASDLLWASKIKATAEALGINARPVRDTAMLDARLADSEVRGVVLDLDTPDTAFLLLNHLKTRLTDSSPDTPRPPIRVAAFAPHVNTEAIERAKREGCSLVLTRGAMDRNMESVLRELDQTPA